ncbi:hypothetical protein ASPZODRAFT_133065 [Penicilliopsis zonata CBS 506.65]|uniref:Something about silencing protein 4 domain-containing protein n=1 Tax=Penicilliopsis zonata CBS 506.65 TaxID=1073090 RepID=A0A1L9SGB3_9EURO|nr:hypothetical protein ASPZODRAFT_133065 [Penicilliopsis zonata CBS 506.65]OJJ46084.1 hypothetical protein ASPZODRAFT_133065 [Penicilliopsis zonata CBS 506.65]
MAVRPRQSALPPADSRPSRRRPRASSPASPPRSPPSPASPPSPHRSSPDLLDTTIDLDLHPTNASGRRRGVQPRRSQPRRPLVSRLETPRRGTLRTTTTATATNSTSGRKISSSTTYLSLHPSSRESPDPLDTISPATLPPTLGPTRAPTRPNAAAAAVAVSSSSPARWRTLHHYFSPAVDTKEDKKEQIERQQLEETRSLGSPPPSSPPQKRAAAAASATPPPANQPDCQRDNHGGRRSLRSQGSSSRAKSELALYFHNYEQILSLEPPKREFLAGDTTVELVDDLPGPLPKNDMDESPFGNPLLNLHDCEKIELPKVEEDNGAKGEEEDPLNEAIYFRAHRRIERQEKRLRNIERDKAQHERMQLERLRDELEGHDWLRVMGVSGVADPDKKLYEPKRAYLIGELSALINKFRLWKEEEKRRKAENNNNSSIKDAPSRMTDSEDPVPAPEGEGKRRHSELKQHKDKTDSLDASDIDAWAAHQLLRETQSAGTAGKRLKTYSRRLAGASTTINHEPPSPAPLSPPLPPPPPPPPERPFTSFYLQAHLRETALSPSSMGRIRYAFGQPIPEINVREFALPAEILTEETINACRRKRRRMKRESIKR